MEQNVLVVGMAKSGVSAAKLCRKLGSKVTVYDSKPKEAFGDLLEELKDETITYIFGGTPESCFSETDLIVMSPGVPTDLPFIFKAREMGIKVIGEIELAARYCPSEILAITGTNGKTTTTTLVGEIMTAFNEDTYVVGNIGNPFCDVVLDTKESTSIVAEISSFQLETIETFKPKVSAILNITEDHINRHKTFENYILAKLWITKYQDESDFCVLNYDDPIVRNLAREIKARILWFSTKQEVDGVYYKDGKIYYNFNGMSGLAIDMKNVNENLLGSHNIENIMAAVLMCMTVNVPLEIINRVVCAFKGVEHRIEYVTTINGVKYFNDSKATNPDAAIKGIAAMITPTILLGGGMDKKSEFDPWIQAFDNKVKALILYGETKNSIQETAIRCGFTNPIWIVENLEEAVAKAHEIATSGDCVLLSPACASWDQFKNFEIRGQLFKDLVLALK